MAVKTNFETNGYKYYKTTKTIGHEIDGTPIKKVFYGKTKTEAESKADDYIQLHKKGVAQLENRSLDFLFYDWLWNVKKNSKNFKSSSFDRYERVYRNDLKGSSIAHCLINEITPLILQRHYNKLYNQGVKSTKIKDINKILSVFFQFCKKQGWININPASKELLELPGDSDKKIIIPEDEDIKIFNDEERIQIIKATTQKIDTLNLIILLALATGMRKGELLGLQTKYIDFDNKLIKVRKTLECIKKYDENNKFKEYQLVLTDPKSLKSVRNIPLPDFIIPYLKEHLTNNEMFFRSKDGNYIDPRNLLRAWKRFLARNDIKYLKFHAIRHTYASLLFREGATLKEVQELLGHSDIKTTEKVYISVTSEDKVKRVTQINNLFKTE